MSIEDIEARLSAATPGPWAVPVANVFRVIAPDAPHHNPRQGLAPGYPWRVIADMGEPDGSADDARLISAAPTDLRFLLDTLAAVKAKIEEAMGECGTSSTTHHRLREALRIAGGGVADGD